MASGNQGNLFEAERAPWGATEEHPDHHGNLRIRALQTTLEVGAETTGIIFECGDGEHSRMSHIRAEGSSDYCLGTRSPPSNASGTRYCQHKVSGKWSGVLGRDSSVHKKAVTTRRAFGGGGTHTSNKTGPRELALAAAAKETNAAYASILASREQSSIKSELLPPGGPISSGATTRQSDTGHSHTF